MDSKLFKLNATPEAEQALERMLTKVNDGFAGGRVTKTQLLSWLLTNTEPQISKYIDAIRQKHFDEIAYLESTVKQMKKARKAGEPVQDLKSCLGSISSGARLARPGTRKKSVVGTEKQLSVLPDDPRQS